MCNNANINNIFIKILSKLITVKYKQVGFYVFDNIKIKQIK